MSVFDDIDKDILDGLRRPAWEVPVEPEGDAAYWRARAEKAEANERQAVGRNTDLIAALTKVYLSAAVAPNMRALQEVIVHTYDSVLELIDSSDGNEGAE